MRRIMCVSCGKSVTVDTCTGQSCRAMSCPDCGGRMVRSGVAGRGINRGRGMNQDCKINQGRGRKGRCGRAV